MSGLASILVVEDEFLVAMELEAFLEDAGWKVVGPAGSLAGAIKLAQSADCDGAVLDVNLGGERVDEVASILAERGIPFVFVTGYGRDNLPAAHRENVLIAKPVNGQTLVQAVRDLLPV
jgi:DNA-binding NarL/FixJ family response regulator